jgi:hypothetical protein
MRIKGIARSFAIGSFVTAGLISVAGPAQATIGECDRGHACIWKHESYSDLDHEFAYHTPANGEGTSIANNGYCGNLSVAYYFDSGDYSGSSIALYCPGSGKQSQDPNLVNGIVGNGYNWSDRISSASFGN